MLDQGSAEKSRPSPKEINFPLGHEINVGHFYQDKIKDVVEGTSHPVFLIGKNPHKHSPEKYQGQKAVHFLKLTEIDKDISDLQLIIKPSAQWLYIENPDPESNIWIKTDTKKDHILKPGEAIRFSNNIKNIRNLKILFAREQKDEPGYRIEATSVSGGKNKALQRLRFSKS